MLLIGGFLGSGKTSFILQLARYMTETMGIRKIAILENEIGEFGVDDKLLRGSGYAVRELFAGCVCCTLAGELPVTVQAIQRDVDPDWIIMEATGMAFPGPIRDNLKWALGLTCRICAMVDARRWKRLFAAMEELLGSQLEDADVILVNKADTVDAETLQNAVTAAQTINPGAEVLAISAAEEIPADCFVRVLGKEC